MYYQEIALEPYTVESGHFRLAEFADQAGKIVTFAQTLTGGQG